MADIRERLRATASSHDLVAVDVPEWESKVYIRKLTVRDQKAINDLDLDPVEGMMRVLILSLVDEQGEQLLDADDYDLLLDQPWALLMPLVTEAAKQNGLTSTELEEAVAAFQGRTVEAAASPDGAGPASNG